MRASFIWKNGELCPWEEAQFHVLSHALHYGSSIFEGLRAYEIADNACILCGPEHFERMLYSCKVAHVPSPLTVDQWMDATVKTLQANEHLNAYIRPLVFRGLGDSLDLDGRSCPADAILATVLWGTYFGQDAILDGIDAQVSSWRRAGSGAANALAKIGGQYVNAQLNVMEARDNGFHEGIALDSVGNVSEGSGQNIFLVLNDELITPAHGCSILSGVTRNCVMKIADDLGLRVKEANIPRDMLYLVDEVFFTGTAVEICPVRSVDRIAVGDGHPGPITKSIQNEFFGIVQGKRPDKWGWLTPVRIGGGASVRNTA